MNRPGHGAASGATTLAVGTTLFAAGSSDLSQIAPLVWTLVAISAAGAVVTFAVLVYALHKFRDPATRRRRYG